MGRHDPFGGGMKRVLLIRHATSQPDPPQPAMEWGLADSGFKESANLARYLQNAQMRPAKIWSSTEKKGVETAQTIAQVLGIHHETNQKLNEQGEGSVPYFEDRERFLQQVSTLFESPTKVAMGNESAAAAANRLRHVLKRTVRYDPAPDIAFVSHGRIITAFLQAYCHIDPVPFWQALTMPALIALEWPTLTIQAVCLKSDLL